jgi:hypothetical protein
MRNYGVLAIGVLASIFSVACGAASDRRAGSPAAMPASEAPGGSYQYAPSEAAAPGPAGYPMQPGMAATSPAASGAIPGFPASAAPPPPAPAAARADDAKSSSPITIAPTAEPAPRRLPQSGQLTAGIWDDNLNFDFFKPYATTFRASNPSDLAMFAQQEMETARDQANKPGAPHGELDVQLVLDTTGSMGDELSYLQSEFDSIAARLKTKFPQVTPRWSLVLYRDKGDDYVTRDFDFTTDTNKFRSNLRVQSAGGGGDIPEAVVQGLETGGRMNWRPAGSVAKVAFWVADAPAHPGEGKQLATVVRNLKAKGIHVYPIASSDTDETAEYQMRSTAQMTGGRYVFLTNDSGVGNGHAEPHIPCYSVTRLDSAILRSIETELTGQRHEAESNDVIRNVGQPDKNGKCKLASGALVASF